jgi:PAS domain S-box-containing protein
MLAPQPQGEPFAAASQTLFREAASVLLDPSTNEDIQTRAAAYPRLAAMLASSIQLLKAADEEIARRESAARDREASLEAELEHERRQFDAVPIPLVVTDMNGSVLAANQATRNLFDVQGAEVIGAPIADFVASNDRADFRTTLARLRSIGGASDWEVRVQPRRHGARPMRASVVVVEGGNRHAGTSALSWCLRPGD